MQDTEFITKVRRVVSENKYCSTIGIFLFLVQVTLIACNSNKIVLFFIDVAAYG